MRHVAYKTWAQGRLARKNSPSTAPSAALPRKSSPSTAPPLALPRKSSPSKRKNADFGVFRACRANFFALTPTIRPRRANFFAHKAQQRGDVETNNTTARPQQGSLETGITSAPEKCTKNTHFSPAKAMTVSIEARPAPAKATTVSGNRTPGRQGQAAVPVGDGGDWPGDQWAANVTNVVKPTRFQSPRENPCYKRRQSKPKNHHYQRRSSPVEWCNRFVSFGVGYALSWSGVSSCWVGWGVSRDLVRTSRLR